MPPDSICDSEVPGVLPEHGKIFRPAFRCIELF